MFRPSIKNNEITLSLSREIKSNSPENLTVDRIRAEIPIQLNFDRDYDRNGGGYFRDGALFGPRSTAFADAPVRGFGSPSPFRDFGGFSNVRDSNGFLPVRDSSALPFGGIFRRGICGRARKIEPPDPNVCEPFGYKNYAAPADTSFLDFIGGDVHISPRCRP
ncbi:MAG: hypothetical protein LBP62_00750 [Clostridiales bacterium]|jgi:hypothetical protein|nr:hypothetical protein [Clostridiales bacterium]